jgi:hypothetical protein
MRLFFKLTPHFRFAVRSVGARCGGEGLSFAKPCNVMIDFMSDKSFLRKMAFAETGDRFNIHRLHAISLGWPPKEKWRLS